MSKGGDSLEPRDTVNPLPYRMTQRVVGWAREGASNGKTREKKRLSK